MRSVQKKIDLGSNKNFDLPLPSKAPPNVQVVVPSEIDPHGPQTQFTDINFDDSDMASDTERETTPFGAGALDPHKRSIRVWVGEMMRWSKLI